MQYNVDKNDSMIKPIARQQPATKQAVAVVLFAQHNYQMQ